MATHTVILASGGIRSLVATASVLSAERPGKVSLLHIRDGRENAPTRHQYAHLQAEHYRLPSTLELELSHLQADPVLHAQGAWAPLVRPQILLVGLAQAAEWQADKLVWPTAFNGDYAMIARITEQIVLLQHLAELEQPNLPHIETPLLELTDKQMIELGDQLGVPWQTAWSCLLQGDHPCSACDGCRRRKQAFASAGVIDPMMDRKLTRS